MQADSGQNDGKIRRHFPIKSATVTVWRCPNIRHKRVGAATIHSVFGRFFDQIKVVLNRQFFYTFSAFTDPVKTTVKVSFLCRKPKKILPKKPAKPDRRRPKNTTLQK
jgi:predicted glycosyltransferase